MASSLFIALGGTGYNVVSALQESNIHLYESRGLTDPNNYLYIDTDEVSIMGVDPQAKNTRIINMGTFAPMNYYRSQAQKNDIGRWFDAGSITMPPNNLQAGAKGIRQLTRMGYYYDPKYILEIESLLNSYLADNESAIKNNANKLATLKVYIISGSAGGTGSGIFADVLYTIWRHFIGKGFLGNLNVKAIIVMPNIFFQVNDHDLKKKYMLNAYAFMQEVNAIVKYGLDTSKNDQFFRFVPSQYTVASDSNWQPITSAVLIDDLNDKFNFTKNFLYDIISEFLSTYTFGKDLKGTDQKVIDGESQSIEAMLDSALTNSDFDRNLPFVNYFNSIGILVVQSATEDFFPRYVQARLKMDLLQSIEGNTCLPEAIVTDDYFLNISGKISQLYNRFESDFLGDSLSLAKPTKTGREELAKILEHLNFGEPLAKVNDTGLHAFVQQLENIRKELSELGEKTHLAINDFMYSSLAEGVPILHLSSIFNQLDFQYYNYYKNSSNISFNGTKSSEIAERVKEILRHKASMHFYYLLSKGHKHANDQGYLDFANRHLESLLKETKTIEKAVDEKEYESLVKDLNELRGNGAKRIVPAIDTLIKQIDSKYIIHPQGALVRWYDQINADISGEHKKLIHPLFSDPDHHKYTRLGSFDAFKFNKSLTELLNQISLDFCENNDHYKAIFDKSLQTIIEEENDQDALNHLKAFNYPFIKLNSSHTISKQVFAGHFEGNVNLPVSLGYNTAEFNDMLLDDPYFKHKIVKIVFFHKISFKDYFNFEKLTNTFKEEFSGPKQSNPEFVMANPFIHKDFAGDDFDGNVFNQLNQVGEKVVLDEFISMNDALKQLMVKFGLIYMNAFIKKAEESGIFKSEFKASVLTFDEQSKVMTIKSIEFDDFLNSYAVYEDLKKINLKNPLNIQGLKPIIHDVCKYLLENINQTLEASSEIACFKVAYTNTVFSRDDQKVLKEPMKNFVDIGNNMVVKDFLKYFELILS